MTPRELVSRIQQAGVFLEADVNSRLKIKGDKTVIDRLLPKLKEHKAEIILFLRQERAAPDEPAVVKDLKPCPLCGGRSFIHGHNGGFFCMACQPGIEGKPVRGAGGARKQEQPSRTRKPVPAMKDKATLPGKVWADRHHAALMAAGWTDKELYESNYPLAGGPIWKGTGLKVALMKDGRVLFAYLNHTGTHITQTAWPMNIKDKSWRKTESN